MKNRDSSPAKNDKAGGNGDKVEKKEPTPE